MSIMAGRAIFLQIAGIPIPLMFFILFIIRPFSEVQVHSLRQPERL